MLQVPHKGRPYLDNQCLQLLILGAGDQGLVDRVENLLVVRDFVVDVSLVKRGAFQGFEVFDVFLAASFETLAGRVVFRGDL